MLQPSVEFETGFPGESWLKGATAAVNKAVERGVADPDRLGIQGTSYGGYATNLLITQANRFKATINISGKVDMISFYGQPADGSTQYSRAGKESGPDRRHAVAAAAKIPPALGDSLCRPDQDATPARQGMEMYYALRRLNKEVAWVLYPDGGHGMPRSSIEEVQDYVQRILDWYATYLKKPADPAPATNNTPPPQ